MKTISVRDALANASEIQYLDDARNFLEEYDFPEELVEAAVRHPDHISLDPNSKEAGYPILRVRRGDLTLSVSLRNNFDEPFVMYIFLNTPEEGYTGRHRTDKQRGQGGGMKHMSPFEKRKWFEEQGCTVKHTPQGLKVTFKDRVIGTIHLTGGQYGDTSKSVHSMMVRKLRQVQADLIKEQLQGMLDG